jgi:lipopolysaccharide export system permease protein
LLSVWFVIVVIIVSRKFIKILEKAVEGHISNETLMTILGLKTVSVSVSLLPAATFMALLMVLGRLYKDQEMAAIAAAGGGAGTLYRAIFVMLLPLSLCSVGLSIYVSPWAEYRSERIMYQDELTSDIRGIAAGKFSEYKHGDLVFYAENITRENKMQAVFMQNRQSDRLSIISAQQSRFDDLPDGRYLVFENGERIVGHPGELNYTIETFNEYALKVSESNTPAPLQAKGTDTATLWKSSAVRDIAELQDRLSLPLEILIFGLLAVPLAKISPRGGVYGSMLLGFLIYFTYGNLSSVFQSWVIKKSISVWPGMFWISLLFFLTGILLLANWYGFTWVIAKIKRRILK